VTSLPSSQNALLNQLGAICETHPIAPKVLLVPRTQHGRALEDALARRREQWAGVSCRLLRHYASQLVRSVDRWNERAELPVEGTPFLIARVLQTLSAGDLPPGLPAAHQLAPTVADTIETLRRAGIEPEAVQDRAERPGAPATLQAVAICYRRYHAHLKDQGLYDDADVFRWATEQIRSGPPPVVSDAVVGICDGVDLSRRSAAFVEALQDASLQFYRLGAPTSLAPPRQTAASRFDTASLPSTGPDTPSPRGPDGPSWQFRRAVGRTAEVEAVLRDILDSDVPFDDVEVAYTDATPYLSRLADTAEEVGVPMTVGTGQPAPRTAPGRALGAFLQWIVEDFDAAVLIRMLRGGLLRVDRVREDGALPRAHEVASLLATHRYESGRRGYRKALRASIEQKDERIAKLRDKQLSTERDEQERAQIKRILSFVDDLLALAPRRTSIQDMAKNLQRFLQRYGPTDKPPDDLPEEDRTLDQAARVVLWQKLDTLTELPFSYTAPLSRAAALLRRWVEGRYVRAQHPQPGAVHVVPLESAGYGDRSNLYVVGMDGESFSAAEVEKGMLRESDRESLRGTERGALLRIANPADETLWRATRALRRQSGAVALYSRTYDVESGEERYPSPLFLRLEAEVGESEPEAPPVGLVPDTHDLPLRDADAWVATRRQRSEGAGGQTARTTLRRVYPWIITGEAARREREGETYGEHDGLLPVEEAADLDLFGGDPVSASRLETLAETPYVYFLEYVLGIEPLDEPALEDEPWLTPLRRGSILHETFEHFMRGLDGRRPSPQDADTLRALLDERIDEATARVAPRSQVEEEAARRQLRRDAMVFLRAEIDHTRAYDPEGFEVGFGMGPRRRQPQDEGRVSLTIGPRQLPLRGRIDRIDRSPSGGLAIWDYKTGRASSYEEDDPLQEGAHLQWALYAYALQSLRGESVDESGYFFPTAAEMGTRLSFRPAAYRDEVEGLIERLGALARSGSFPMTPHLPDATAWRYRGYERLVHDLRTRARVLKDKAYPDDRPAPPFLD